RNGVASGTLVGGHIGSLALLIGTDFMPSPKDTVLFIEADESSSLEVFDRDLQSLIYSDFFKTVRGILIGRFSEKYHKLSIEALKKVIESKKIKIPVIANMDFGHTNPMITIPIGGKCNLISEKNCIVNFYIH
ncbi:MAG: LD-carboxypeptidase, partial [bacterium]|nr:LD-carboxypeptidase [bacterium]